LASNTTGRFNTAIGVGAGSSNVAGSGNVYLGYQAGFSETGSDKLYIANNGTAPLIYGDFIGKRVGIATVAPTATLSVNGSANKPGGGSWTVFSDERLKDINGSYSAGLDAIMQLEPIVYHYKQDNPLKLPDQPEYIGFSAQALQKVIPEAVNMSSAGFLEVNNDPVFWTMLNAIKELKQQKDKEMAARDQQISKLEADKDADIAALKAENEKLAARQAKLETARAASLARVELLESRMEMLTRAMVASHVAQLREQSVTMD